MKHIKSIYFRGLHGRYRAHNQYWWQKYQLLTITMNFSPHLDENCSHFLTSLFTKFYYCSQVLAYMKLAPKCEVNVFKRHFQNGHIHKFPIYGQKRLKIDSLSFRYNSRVNRYACLPNFFFSILNIYTCKHKIYNHQSYIYLICLGIKKNNNNNKNKK